MNNNSKNYQVVDLTPSRRVWLNTLEMTWSTHTIYGLLEVDVTIPCQVIADHKARSGESLSFTGYLTYCLGRAVDADKSVQAYRKGGKQLVIFNDVDVGLMIEATSEGKKALMGYVVRQANHKTFQEIHQEIRQVQTKPAPANRGMPGWYRRAMLLPAPLTGLFKAFLRSMMRRDPAINVSMAGTVSISSVGMFGGDHSGWALSPTPQPLALLVGSTAWKPAVVEGRIEPRQILHLTVLFDHDIIDGGPAARFTHQLVKLIESGCGMEGT